MTSTAPQAGFSASRNLGLHENLRLNPAHSDAKDNPNRPLKSITNPFSSGQLFNRPSLPTLADVENPSLHLPSTGEQPLSPKPRRRPRHVPIVITQGLIASVLKGLPDTPELHDGEWSDDVTKLYENFGNKAASTQPLARRPRHIPIVIPDFAQPYNPFALPTPPSSGESTPNQLQSPLAPQPGTPMQTSNLNVGASRPATADSSTAASEPSAPYLTQTSNPPAYLRAGNRSQTSLSNEGGLEPSVHGDLTSRSTEPTPQASSFEQQNSGIPTASGPGLSHQQAHGMVGNTNLSGLMCNVHRCTGKEPHALVGATTTILGDKLYIFGGKRLSRRRPQLTADLYELDLIRRHWTKLETTGDVPPPRYFHSVCALGDNKLICYGGMSPAPSSSPKSQSSSREPDQPTEVIVMSDIHIYDVNSRTWTHVETSDDPQGRYAHCATVLPSFAVFTSADAPRSAIHHNPSSGNPNQGSIGVALDGTGGAEMVVVGGQDSANHYIEQVSVFNLRSLKWTSTNSLGRSCGAYRSVVAPLVGMSAQQIGISTGAKEAKDETRQNRGGISSPSSMLIYSNYNFLDVKLELQVRLPDGTLIEKQMSGQNTPPGLRFPNGGVLNHHFIVSGTFLTSSKQEYALWALNLKTLTWTRIDAGNSIFSQGSWNRGVLWPRRNTFVILGNRKRNLIDDYNHRRINFSNMCLVELEAFGFYDNPRHVDPTSAYSSFSTPALPPSLRPKLSTWAGGGRPHFAAAEDLGLAAMNIKELADMEILSISGERILANSHVLARRWGPYFVHLLREGASPASNIANDNGIDTATLRPTTGSAASRNSSITITPSLQTAFTTTTLTGGNSSSSTAAVSSADNTTPFHPPNTTNLPAPSRSRTLYLPHTPLTIQALLHFLYTSSLPPPNHVLSTPQILCSLLQIARPYCIDGLLEAVVERLHQVMDGRNAPAVFNASAMAAGGGRGTGFKSLGGVQISELDLASDIEPDVAGSNNNLAGSRALASSGTNLEGQCDLGADDSEDDASSVEGAPEPNGVDTIAYVTGNSPSVEEEVWNADRSCVVGLQKRGLRGLMEGRRMRERGRSIGIGGAGAATEV